MENETARAPARRGAVILSFDAASARRVRRMVDPTETVGEILLFMGVRYERRSSEETSFEETGSEICAVAARAGKPS